MASSGSRSTSELMVNDEKVPLYHHGESWKFNSPSWRVFTLVATVVALVISIVAIAISAHTARAPPVLCPVSLSANSPVYVNSASPPSDAQVNYTFVFRDPHSLDLKTKNGNLSVADVRTWPALHNLAISQTLFELEPNGANSPHHHPDAVEILFVFEGAIEACRVEPNPGRLYCNILTAPMSVVFPRGHIHFQRNICKGVARYISTLNSEKPGVSSLAQRTCDLPLQVLLSAFGLDTIEEIEKLCAKAKGRHLPDNPIEYRQMDNNASRYAAQLRRLAELTEIVQQTDQETVVPGIYQLH